MVLEVKRPRPLWEILFSTHHTDIGLLYIISSIAFLFMGGALALAIRSELFLPGAHFFGMGPNDFERIFTVHGTDMLLLWVIPFGAGVGNYLIPIFVRYKDMAWPKLNAVAFWMIPVAASLIWLGFSDTGWTAYPYLEGMRIGNRRSRTCPRVFPNSSMIYLDQLRWNNL